MAIIIPQESEYAKEIRKWEATRTDAGPGLRPYVKRDYPMTMYRAGRPEGDNIGIVDTVEVASELQMANYASRGYFQTPNEAYDGLMIADQEAAKLAANRAWHERRMSPKAQAEAAAAEAESSGHLASVPPTPIRRRRKKNTPVSPSTGDAV